MFTHLMRVAVGVVLAGLFGPQLAHADVYTWVDGSGMVNVSNLDPPEGVRVIKTIRAPKETPREEAARDAARQAEVRALAARVQQLQDEVDQARRQPPVQMEYRAVPAPPAYPPYVDPGPPPVQYAYNAEPPMNYGYGCDISWMNCGLGWGSGFYPANVVVLRAPNFRRFNPGHGGHRFDGGNHFDGGKGFGLVQPLRPPGGGGRRR